MPNTEALKCYRIYNTLLGSPRQLICQCCGMPLEESNISKEADGFFNEEYCKWCYADGEYMYDDMDDLIDVCVKHMVSDEHSEEEVRLYFKPMKLQLREVTPKHIQDFYTEQRKRVKGSTVKSYHANIHKAFKDARKLQLIDVTLWNA